MRYTKMAAAITAAALAGSVLAAAPAGATAPGCISQPWGFLGSKQRVLCDGPILADGSWMRHRVVGRGAYWANPSSSCSGSLYYSSCSYDPGGYVAEVDSDDEWYPVTEDTVLPDEPGHIS